MNRPDDEVDDARRVQFEQVQEYCSKFLSHKLGETSKEGKNTLEQKYSQLKPVGESVIRAANSLLIVAPLGTMTLAGPPKTDDDLRVQFEQVQQYCSKFFSYKLGETGKEETEQLEENDPELKLVGESICIAVNELLIVAQRDE